MMDQAVLKMVKVGDCVPTSDNPRLVNEDSERFRLLAASVAAEGVKEPVKVRPHPTKKGKYDLRDGARRHRAAELAGVAEIPALVFENTTDAEAFEMTFVSFFGREDLAPIEEAKAVSLYLEKYAGDLERVADKLGQTPRWVKRRANVFENLERCWSAAVETNEDQQFSDWTISHLELIARFDRQTQRRLLEEYGYNRGQSVAEIADWCNDQLRRLAAMPWAADAVLTDAAGDALPVCAGCSRRSGAEPLLWEEADQGDDERCLDAVCFEAKRTAAMRQQIDATRAQYPNLRLVMVGGKQEYATYTHRGEMVERFGKQIFEHVRDWSAGKKNDPAAVPFYVLGGKSAGKVVWRTPPTPTPQRAGRGSATDAGSDGDAGATPSGGKTLEEKRDGLGRKRWQQVLKDLHGAARTCTIDAVVHEDKAYAMLLIAMQFGTYGFRYERDLDWVAEMAAANAARLSIAQQAFSEELAVFWINGIRPMLLEFINYGGPLSQTPDDKIEAAQKVATLLGIDLDALHDKAVKDNPEPASWTKGEAQGEKKKKL